jgi:hexokinase
MISLGSTWDQVEINFPVGTNTRSCAYSFADSFAYEMTDDRSVLPEQNIDDKSQSNSFSYNNQKLTN